MLVVQSLSKSFKEKPVLSGFSLTARPGEIVFLTGPSGSGKSTALRAIANLDPCDADEISLDGQTPTSLGFVQWRRDVMYVPQSRISQSCTPRELFVRALNFKSRCPQPVNVEELVEYYVQVCVDMGLERRNLVKQKWSELSGGEFTLCCGLEAT